MQKGQSLRKALLKSLAQKEQKRTLKDERHPTTGASAMAVSKG
jgi:hypothetical protein